MLQDLISAQNSAILAEILIPVCRIILFGWRIYVQVKYQFQNVTSADLTLT